jgi:hypothetical protein
MLIALWPRSAISGSHGTALTHLVSSLQELDDSHGHARHSHDDAYAMQIHGRDGEQDDVCGRRAGMDGYTLPLVLLRGNIVGLARAHM